MHLEQSPRPSGGLESESCEAVVEATVASLADFVRAHHRPDDFAPVQDLLADAVLERFRQVYRNERQSFQWTPAMQAFKRITAFYPSRDRRERGEWNGELVVVVANKEDTRDEVLTKELNELIHQQTNQAWFSRHDL